jgi:demethylmenaquinone methyltransferase/2-methoxy-6-polyprenyl-1,4-benzoquinol methylase
MTSSLPSIADKPRFVADMFGRIAWRYDLMNTLMTGGQDQRWRRLVAESAVVASPPNGRADRHSLAAPRTLSSTRPLVLDVGTGTGKLLQAVAAWTPDAFAVGIDFTLPMLCAAPTGLTLAGADALQLPFADASFDAVVSAFVVRNLADARAGLTEQVRVLRPGGRLVVLETTPGPPNLLRPLYRLYFRQLVPRLGQLIAGDPVAYTYLPDSALAFLEPARLAAALRDSGLDRVTTRRLAFGSVAITAGRKPPALR